MRTKALLSVLVLFSLLASCNMPAGQVTITGPSEVAPVSSDPNALATAVELTAVARVTEIAGSAVPATSTFTAVPTATWTSVPAVAAGPCSPLVTATVNANVRSGPDTAYDIVGSLSLGQTATIVGRNDAYTWWYIDYPGIAGNHAWIAGSVVTSACVPAVVQVVAAPPLPTAVVVEAPPTEIPDDDGNGPIVLVPIPNLQLKLPQPDLVLIGIQLSSDPATQGVPITVKVKVENSGNANAGSFNVIWWSAGSTVGCTWSVSSLAEGASKVLTCPYTYGGWNNAYQLKAMVDPEHAVAESNETNNVMQRTLQVLDAP